MQLIQFEPFDSEFIHEWVKALRSGEYQQGGCNLYNTGDDSYCCLGVACSIKGISDFLLAESGTPYQLFKNDIPLDVFKTMAPELLKETYTMFSFSTNPSQIVETLIHMNDGIYNPTFNSNEKIYSFNEIADWIEKNLLNKNKIMTYTQQDKEAIIKEATTLKVLLHKEERENLNIETFDPSLPHGCIYGQATGECHSLRARHLLQKAAVPYSVKIDEYVPTANEAHFESRKKFIVGHEDVYSIMEFAAFNDDNFRHHVIPFLKGDTDTLEF